MGGMGLVLRTPRATRDKPHARLYISLLLALQAHCVTQPAQEGVRLAVGTATLLPATHPHDVAQIKLLLHRLLRASAAAAAVAARRRGEVGEAGQRRGAHLAAEQAVQPLRNQFLQGQEEGE